MSTAIFNYITLYTIKYENDASNGYKACVTTKYVINARS
jgi:hypothetical protein